jgi:UTP--glucose-1-phosphate uridylyltransferase
VHVTDIRRALLPVAGKGTRMHPVTTAVPKELLPIGTRPLIEFALEEARDAGLRELVLVTARGKSAVEDFVDDWSARQRNPLAVSYVRQREQRGLGHAVLVAAHLLDGAPFAVMLPDDLLPGPPFALRDLMAAHRHSGRAAVLLQSIRAADSASYGVPRLRRDVGADIVIEDLVEKPAPAAAPSRFGVVGRYVVPASILARLEDVAPGAGGEIQLTDALAALARDETIVGVALRQPRLDCGSPAGYLAAQQSVGAAQPAIRRAEAQVA